MYAFGDGHKIDGRSSVVTLLQGRGDIVQVPPGWPHAVANLKFCGKLAWDYIDTDSLHDYLVVRRDISGPLFRGDQIADDYMAVGPILSATISKAVRHLNCA